MTTNLQLGHPVPGHYLALAFTCSKCNHEWGESNPTRTIETICEKCLFPSNRKYPKPKRKCPNPKRKCPKPR